MQRHNQFTPKPSSDLVKSSYEDYLSMDVVSESTAKQSPQSLEKEIVNVYIATKQLGNGIQSKIYQVHK